MLFRSNFWKVEVEDAALLIMSKAVSPSTGLTGEAPVARSEAHHVADSSSGAPPGRGANARAAGPSRGRGGGARSRSRLPPGERSYNVDNRGWNITNRSNKKLCSAFQSGSCVGSTCTIDINNAHQCAICLDNRHGADKCPSGTQKGKGKKGKGKGKNYHG